MNAPLKNRPMGIVRGMSFEDYLAIEAVSNTDMKLLSRSAWHWRNRQPVVPTRPMLCGSLVHCAQLEPDALAARYFVMPKSEHKKPTDAQWNAKNPSESSRAAMDWWTEQLKKAGSRIVIEAGEFDITQQQLAAIKANDEIAQVFASGDSEVSMFWIDPKTGAYCKARPDHIHRSRGRVVMVDLKAMADDTPAGVQRSIGRMGLYRQQAHYMRGFEVIEGKPVDDFFFAVVSSVPPVLAMPHRLTFDALEQGVEEIDELLAEFSQCQKTDRWPAYKPEQRMHTLPAWLKSVGEVQVEFDQ